ncbi:MAG: type II toxin-antitoxin system RelE/ParE family toxin [Firmicutes bacterium]|nr:type II toxin-antitoxin system RelE/ParE family toxin [Bacillota bacterium]
MNKYILIYRIDEENNIVYVIRFFYGGQNYIDLI